MVRFVIAALGLLAFACPAFAQPAPYVMECSPGTCVSPLDGTTQAAGTFVRRFDWDPNVPYTLPSGVIAVPDTGQTVYAPAPNPLAQVQSAFSNGFTLTSTATPALNGTYPVNTTFMQAMQQEELCLLATPNDFCNLQTTRAIPDSAGGLHTFNKAQFNNFLLAVGTYLDALIWTQIQDNNGGTATPPTAAATIP